MYIVREELPFTKFKKLIKLQKVNGVPLLSGKSNRKACATMVGAIAQMVRDDIRKIMAKSRFLSGGILHSHIIKISVMHHRK